MCKSGFVERGEEVLSVLASAETSGFEIDFKINGKSDNSSFLEEEWETLELSLFKRVANYDEALNCLKLTVLLTVSSILPLITEQIGELEEEASPDFRIEGNLERVYVNRYERSRLNRAICLELYGFICIACNLRMADIYGPIGEGVIHVHHIEPVSQMETPRVLNPALDLVPLCPNCHAIVHRTNPPLSIQELRDKIEI
jgi:5-methylcytosine-specific restriction protein A